MKLLPPYHFFPYNTRIDFIGWRWWGFGISILFTLMAFGFIAKHSLNWGIDFTGGVLMDVRLEQPADLAVMRASLEDKGLGEVSLQNFGDNKSVLVRIQTNEDAEGSVIVPKVKEYLNAGIGQPIEYRNIEFVGPTVGKELITSGILATVLACLGIMIYVWFRFEWQFGIGTILALVHDTAMVIGFYAFSGFDFGLTAVAAVLTIIGYSMNDTVVIYDRIRENMRRYKKMPMGDLINLSMNETLARTLLTSITTLLAALALAIFGGEVIKGFSWALVFGIVVGSYSSIFISAPTLIYLNIRPDSPTVVTES